MTESDLDWLAGAPQDFIDFVASMLEPPGDCRTVVTVDEVQAAGWALGAVEGCGGAVVIWQRSDQGWGDALASQDALACDDLAMAGVPPALLAGSDGSPSMCAGENGMQFYVGAD